MADNVIPLNPKTAAIDTIALDISVKYLHWTVKDFIESGHSRTALMQILVRLRDVAMLVNEKHTVAELDDIIQFTLDPEEWFSKTYGEALSGESND